MGGEETIQFYYDRETNLMFDDGGYIIWNIYDYISPQMFYLFKTNMEDMVVYGNQGQVVELFYPDFDLFNADPDLF